jgi:tetratricopeptide (TPR) repeat protein
MHASTIPLTPGQPQSPAYGTQQSSADGTGLSSCHSCASIASFHLPNKTVTQGVHCILRPKVGAHRERNLHQWEDCRIQPLLTAGRGTDTDIIRFPKLDSRPGEERKTMSDLLANPKLCGACNIRSAYRLMCACKLFFYSGTEGQGKHWHTHKKSSSASPTKKIREVIRDHGKDDVEVGKARMQAGYKFWGQGRYKEAERCYLDAKRIAIEVCGEGSTIIGSICRSLGDMYSEMERYEEAMALQKQSLRIARRTMGERSEDAGITLRSIGDILIRQGEFEEALARLEEAHCILKETVGQEHSQLGAVVQSKGNCYHRMGRLDMARPAYEEALRISRIALGNHNGQVACSLQNLGNVFSDIGMLSEARANFEEALGIFLRLHGEMHPDVAVVHHNIAMIHNQQGQLDEALKMHENALKIQRRVLGEGHQDVALSLENIGVIYYRQGKNNDALKMYEEALAVYTRALGVDNYQNADVHDSIARSKKDSGDVSGAIDSARESVQIFAKLGISDDRSQQASDFLRRLEGGK